MDSGHGCLCFAMSFRVILNKQTSCGGLEVPLIQCQMTAYVVCNHSHDLISENYFNIKAFLTEHVHMLLQIITLGTLVGINWMHSYAVKEMTK